MASNRVVSFLALMLCVACATACAPVLQNDPPNLAVVAEPDCGLPLVVNSQSGRPGVSRIRSGEDVRACALPLADDIEVACEFADAVHGDGGQRSAPTYRIANAECTFANNERTRALCTFDLAGAEGAPLRRETTLSHRFLNLSDETAHDYFLTSWHAGGSCRAAP